MKCDRAAREEGFYEKSAGRSSDDGAAWANSKKQAFNEAN